MVVAKNELSYPAVAARLHSTILLNISNTCGICFLLSLYLYTKRT